MSTHVVEDDVVRWVFGWDQSKRSYFLQKTVKAQGLTPVFEWGMNPFEMPDPEGLILLAGMLGLSISADQRVVLFREKEFEKATFYVVHYKGDFVGGYPAHSLTHAESLQILLRQMDPDRDVLIRRVVKKVIE